MENGIPNDIQQFWEVSRTALVPPTLTAALKVLQQFTQLPIERLSIIDTPAVLKTSEATTKPKIKVQENPRKKISQLHTKTSTKSSVKEAKAQVQATPFHSKAHKGHLNPERLAAELGYGGAFIKRVREHRNITIEQIHSKTKIKIAILRALETESFEELPSTTFVRGYLGNIAKVLRIEHLPFVSEYMRRYRSH